MTAMNDDSRAALKQKLEANRLKRERLMLEKEKERLAGEIDGFSEKYRFADETESGRAESFIGSLRLEYPFCRYFEGENSPTAQGEMYLCFLMGSPELFRVCIYGRQEDLMSDIESFEVFSSYILLIGEDFERYILYGNGKFTERRISEGSD